MSNPSKPDSVSAFTGLVLSGMGTGMLLYHATRHPSATMLLVSTCMVLLGVCLWGAVRIPAMKHAPSVLGISFTLAFLGTLLIDTVTNSYRHLWFAAIMAVFLTGTCLLDPHDDGASRRP